MRSESYSAIGCLTFRDTVRNPHGTFLRADLDMFSWEEDFGQTQDLLELIYLGWPHNAFESLRKSTKSSLEEGENCTKLLVFPNKKKAIY